MGHMASAPRERASVTFQLSSLFGRIRLYKSGSRGSVLKKVAKNMPAASTLLSKFRGGSSKRVYFLLKSDDENGGKEILALGLFAGSVTEWSTRQTHNPAVTGSSPALTTIWTL